VSTVFMPPEGAMQFANPHSHPNSTITLKVPLQKYDFVWVKPPIAARWLSCDCRVIYEVYLESLYPKHRALLPHCGPWFVCRCMGRIIE
jgi:hypothetical protein